MVGVAEEMMVACAQATQGNAGRCEAGQGVRAALDVAWQESARSQRKATQGDARLGRACALR